MTIVKAALECCGRGWYVFPLLEREKKPLTKHGFKDASNDPLQIQMWWTEHPGANLGLDCGRSGLTVVDIDAERGGMETWAALGSPTATLTSETGGGGRHYIYRTPVGITIHSGNNRLGPGIDVKATGGYVVLPPSIHPNGKRYRWCDPREPVELPEELLRRMKDERGEMKEQEGKEVDSSFILHPSSFANAALTRELATLRAAREGTRNEQLYRSAYALGRLAGAGLLDQNMVEGELYDAARDIGLGEQEAMRTLENGVRNGMKRIGATQQSCVRGDPAELGSGRACSVLSPLSSPHAPLPSYAQLPADLDTRSEWLDAYIAFSEIWSPRSFAGFHEACGLWVLSTVAARRIVAHLGKARYPNLYIGLVARTSIYAKSTDAQIAQSVLHAAGLDFLLAPDQATPASFVQEMVARVPEGFENYPPERQEQVRQRLAFAGQRGWFYEEFGQQLQGMMRESGVMADFRGLMRRLDDCPPSYEATTIGRGRDQVDAPYLALLANLTPADMRPFAKKGAALWNDGYFARFAFVAPPGGENSSRARFPKGERVIPPELLRPLCEWHARLGLPEVRFEQQLDVNGKPMGQKKVVVVRPPVRVYEYADEVMEAFYNYHDGLTELAQGSENEDLDGNYTRMAEKAFRIALLLASVEHAERIELRHWARAQAITERWREGLHALLGQLSAPGVSRERELEDKVWEVVARLGSATPTLVTHQIRSIDSSTAARIMQNMAVAGRLALLGLTRTGTPRYGLVE